MSLTHEDVRRILEILDKARDLDFLELSLGKYRLRAARNGALPDGAPPAPVAPTEAASLEAPAEPPAPATPAQIPAGMQAIRAPMAGTFYATPSPDEPPFVREGSLVAKGDTLCLVEVMKMFNSIAAPIAGRVHRIAAAHGTPVATGDVLMILAPEGA